MRKRTKRQLLAGVGVVLLAAAWSGPAPAQVFNCKVCTTDAYGQAICVLAGGPGPEGGVNCTAGQYCTPKRCYEVCYTDTPCTWV
ncbi:MAG: hypothetical protein M3O15_01365 [Acidobacteriota bacterium]|nr:hypothetical protein [Acidobacteriota bacterium]